MHPFTPIITDLDRFELDLCTYLEQRSQWRQNFYVSDARALDDNATRHSFAWIGLLFAVLASGIQFSNMSFNKRQTQSQPYGRGHTPINYMNSADLSQQSAIHSNVFG